MGAMKFVTMTMVLLGAGLAGCAGPGNGNGGAGGATGAAPARYIGERPNVNGTWNGSTSSSSMLMQRIKEESARDATRRATSGGASTQY